ncbi:hypothetical protein MMC12_002216 [Toensbergia leucococca]|nr:hypothetical protein [Toensbergia leucococca]
MPGDLILLTGGTGHIGFATLSYALNAGYHVRASIRRPESVKEMKAAPSIQPFLQNLSFVTVEDITKDGAFDEALKDVVYVIHLASPLAKNAGDDMENNVVQPAIRGTMSMLESALKVPSVERIVITSSEAAVIPVMAMAGKPTDEVFDQNSVVPKPSGPYPNPFAAYIASKVLSLHATQDFMKEKSPSFTVINIMPSFVWGKNELATTPKAAVSGSNARVLEPLLGVKSPMGLPGTTVHIDDVAMLHVEALNPKLQGNQDFTANSEGIEGLEWNDVPEIVARKFPEAVKSGILPLGGSQPTLRLKYDASHTEKVFDFKFKGLEEQVTNVAGWYIELVEKEKMGQAKA